MAQVARHRIVFTLIVSIHASLSQANESLGNGVTQANLYMDYATFRALAALAPELAQPRFPGGYTEEGFMAWARGEMRIRRNGYFIEDDFNKNGTQDGALVLISKDQFFLLIAERTRDSWVSRALLPLSGESTIRWDGVAVWIEAEEFPGVFVRWAGNGYQLRHGPDPSSDPTSGWRTYRNEQHGVEFKYPADLEPLEGKASTFRPPVLDAVLNLCFSPVGQPTACEVELYVSHEVGKIERARHSGSFLGLLRGVEERERTRAFVSIGTGKGVWMETTKGAVAYIIQGDVVYLFFAPDSALMGRSGFEALLSSFQLLSRPSSNRGGRE